MSNDNKLIHQLLREWADSEDPMKCALEWFDIDDPFSSDLSGNIFEDIADEIDYCYIPRPRFEDGEPVQFGENHGNGKEWLYAVKIYQTGEFSLIGSAGEEVKFKKGERVKRPDGHDAQDKEG